MKRFLLLVLALLGPSCSGGGGGTTPSVRSNSEEVKSRRDEIQALADVPADASKEVPTLLRTMSDSDPQLRWLAEFALGRVDERGIKALVQALRDDSVKIRQSAAFVLGPMGKKARSAISALLSAASDQETGVRVWALSALGDIHPGHPDVVRVVVRTLRDPEPDVRRVALSIVIRLGPAATGASPVLMDVLQDADAGIRAMACTAFRQLASDGKSGIPALIGRLSDVDQEVRVRAAEALTRIGTSAQDPLVRALKDRDPRTRRGAAEVLGSYGGEAKSVLVDLTEAAKDEEAAVRDAAAASIKKIQEGDTAAKGSSYVDTPGAVQRRSEEYKWAKFGLLVHAGLPSVPARSKPGQSAELVLANDRIPLVEYEQFAAKLGMANFKPQDWAKLANESGARYLVMTAKHHDGFCLWNTKLTTFNAARSGPKRDVVGELAAACQKENVKFGIYYSMLDWYQPTYERKLPQYVEFLHGQVKELLAAYPLWGLWFDGEWGHSKDEWRSDELVAAIRQAKPVALLNDRLGRDTRATIAGVDFYTQDPEAPVATLKLQGRPTTVESSLGFGRSWAYTESPDPLKSGERILGEIVDAVSKGGNFLLQIGTRPDGNIPEAFQARLKVIGSWLRRNGDAIYDTERSPFNGPLPAGRVTVKNNRLYVFLEELPKDGLIVLPGLKTPIREAWVLDGRRELKVRDNGVDAPGDLLPGPFTVVAIELERAPEVTK
jgi:alpha-L-fucosidase